MFIREKLIPQSLEAEQSTLGAMFIDPTTIDLVVDTLKAEDFQRELHKTIYGVLLDLHAKGHSLDIVSVSEALKKKGQLEKVGGSEYLFALISACPGSGNIESYARIVVDKSRLRRLLLVSDKIQAMCYGQSDESANWNADDIAAQAESLVMSASREANIVEAKPLGKVLVSVLADLENRLANRASSGLPTGFLDLDRMTGGLYKQHLTILAARPAMGKTSFAMQLALHVATVHRLPTMVVSLEMKDEQLVTRIIANHARLGSKRFERAMLDDDEIGETIEAVMDLENAPLFIFDKPEMTMSEIRAQARRLESKQGPLGLIVVDYLQLARECKEAKPGTLPQVTQQVAQALKTLARERNCPVIALSQLSRAVEQRENKRPMLSDLRDSGGIEAEADEVVFLYRDGYYRNLALGATASEPGAEAVDDTIAEIILGKQRSGPTGTVQLLWTGQSVRFDNLAGSYDAERAEQEARSGYVGVDDEGFAITPAPVFQGPMTSRGYSSS